MMLAYGLLAAGYLGVWVAPCITGVGAALTLVALGASIIKPAITGTVQRTSSEQRRPVGSSIYYTLVDIGGFLGPKRRLGELLRDFGGILTTPRLMTLFLLVAGFWSLFSQCYGAFTTYLTQDLSVSQQRANFIISLDAARNARA